MVQAYRRKRGGEDNTAAPAQDVKDLPLRRNSLQAQAARAAVLLDDPRWRAAFDEARAEAIAEIEATALDGSEAGEARVLERVRQLQALLKVKQIVMRPLMQQANVQGGTPT